MSFETENKVYSLITSFQKNSKRTPTVRWIAEKMGFKSTRSAKQYIDKLADAGRIIKDETGKICFLTPPGLPILSEISAGYAREAVLDSEVETINFDEFITNKKDNLYVLKVKGDSMEDAGIQEGDMVVVQQDRNANLGDIVVAFLDDGWTLKRLMKDGNKFYLKAENPKYPEFIPKESLEIGGVVVGIVRKYH